MVPRAQPRVRPRESGLTDRMRASGMRLSLTRRQRVLPRASPARACPSPVSPVGVTVPELCTIASPRRARESSSATAVGRNPPTPLAARNAAMVCRSWAGHSLGTDARRIHECAAPRAPWQAQGSFVPVSFVCREATPQGACSRDRPKTIFAVHPRVPPLFDHAGRGRNDVRILRRVVRRENCLQTPRHYKEESGVREGGGWGAPRAETGGRAKGPPQGARPGGGGTASGGAAGGPPGWAGGRGAAADGDGSRGRRGSSAGR